jgi:hypothetical protein
MMKNEKKANQIFDGSFPSEKSLSFLILAHVLRHNNKNTYLQTMFAATQQIASIAGLKATKVQVRFTSSSLLFYLYYPSSSSSSSSSR